MTDPYCANYSRGNCLLLHYSVCGTALAKLGLLKKVVKSPNENFITKYIANFRLSEHLPVLTGRSICQRLRILKSILRHWSFCAFLDNDDELFIEFGKLSQIYM